MELSGALAALPHHDGAMVPRRSIEELAEAGPALRRQLVAAVCAGGVQGCQV